MTRLYGILAATATPFTPGDWIDEPVTRHAPLSDAKVGELRELLRPLGIVAAEARRETGR